MHDIKSVSPFISFSPADILSSKRTITKPSLHEASLIIEYLPVIAGTGEEEVRHVIMPGLSRDNGHSKIVNYGCGVRAGGEKKCLNTREIYRNNPMFWILLRYAGQLLQSLSQHTLKKVRHELRRPLLPAYRSI